MIESRDELNYTLHGCSVRFLRLDDVIPKEAFIRKIYPDNWCDDTFDTSYKRDNWNGLAWHKVSDEFRGWIGNTYRDYCKHCDGVDDEDEHEVETATMLHEIVVVIGER